LNGIVHNVTPRTMGADVRYCYNIHQDFINVTGGKLFRKLYYYMINGPLRTKLLTSWK